MKKLVLMFVLFISLTELMFASDSGYGFAMGNDDVQYLKYKVREVETELGLDLVITDTYRTWDEQIKLMWKRDESTLTSWYGADVASTFIKYRNGELGKEELLKVMKQCPYIKHPNGLAVDIGVNSSGLNDYQVKKVKDALERKGLYVFDERSFQEPCIHVSRNKH